jgi:predicted HTH transcriptional regulator
LHKSNLLNYDELKIILKKYAFSKLQKFNNNIINILELEKEAKTSYEDEGVLTSMLADGENKQLELKESYSKNELGRAVSAFANTEGGRIVFGIGEKDKTEKNYKSEDIFLEKYVIYGVEMNEDKFRQNMASHLAHTLNLKEILNKIYEPRVLNLNGKKIVCIDVNNITKTYGKLVTYDENLYVRRDNRTDKLTAKDTIEFYDSLSQSTSH